MFSILSKNEFIILATFNWSSANAFNLVEIQILSFGNVLSVNYYYVFEPCIVKKGHIVFVKCIVQCQPGFVFTNHSLQHSLSYSPDFSMYRSI